VPDLTGEVRLPGSKRLVGHTLAADVSASAAPSRASAEAHKRQQPHGWLIARTWEFGFYPCKTEPWHWCSR
jgi:hypothetical protein